MQVGDSIATYATAHSVLKRGCVGDNMAWAKITADPRDPWLACEKARKRQAAGTRQGMARAMSHRLDLSASTVLLFNKSIE